MTDARKRLEQRLAKGLQRAAVYFYTQHMQRLSVPSPHRRIRGRMVYTNPSQPPEYPKLRTGAGRDSTWWEPRSIQAIIAAGLKVRIGYKPTIRHRVGNHLLALEHKGWSGLAKTLADTKPQLAALITAS
jgi:hypothetical protein